MASLTNMVFSDLAKQDDGVTALQERQTTTDTIDEIFGGRIAEPSTASVFTPPRTSQVRRSRAGGVEVPSTPANMQQDAAQILSFIDKRAGHPSRDVEDAAADAEIQSLALGIIQQVERSGSTRTTS